MVWKKLTMALSHTHQSQQYMHKQACVFKQLRRIRKQSIIKWVIFMQLSVTFSLEMYHEHFAKYGVSSRSRKAKESGAYLFIFWSNIQKV